MQDQIGDGWQQIGFLAKTAVLILLLSAVPAGIALWRLTRQFMVDRSARVGVVPRSPRGIPGRQTAVAVRWAILEFLTLAVALGLFWVSWARATSQIDCAGAGCVQGLSELRALHLTFMPLVGIPMLGAFAWLLIGRMSGARWQI